MNPFTFDLRYIWLCAALNFVGGGAVGYEAMQYTVANSISTENNRYDTDARKLVNTIANKPADPPSSSTSARCKSSTNSSQDPWHTLP